MMERQSEERSEDVWNQWGRWYRIEGNGDHYAGRALLSSQRRDRGKED